ncbi:MAG TPA: NAD-dependent epimerase/dehydratase family protein [Kofleriaceae bacterium]|jgi:nucleoside-diphosphate-sugar epimerase
MAPSDRTIAVTGGTGFLGQAICRALRASGLGVRSLLRSPTDVSRVLAAEGVQFVEGDLANTAALDKLCQGAESVVHCAAYKPKKQPSTSDLINVQGTKDLVTAAQRNGVRKFIYVSSISVYRGTPQPEGGYTEALRPILDPRLNPYAFTKLAGEHAVEELCSAAGMAFVILRPTNVYGAGSLSWDESVASTLKTWHIKFGRMDFDFVSLTDVVDATVAAVTSDVANEAFNIGGEMVDHVAFCTAIAKQRNIGAISLPRPIDWTIRWSLRLMEKLRGNIRGMDYTRPALYPHDKATRLLGYRPRPFGAA